MSDVDQALVGEELRRLHDALATLPDAAWRQDSLCAGWTISHVIAHLTMPARYDGEAYGRELAADGFDFTKMSDRIAERDSTRSPADLLTDLASETLAGFAMPGGGVMGSLSHVVIHGLDATVPAGLGSVAGEDALAAVLDSLTAGGGHAHFGTSLEDDDEAAPAHLRILRLTGRQAP
jgi:uncharacterized protein (TIGR03083 family)